MFLFQTARVRLLGRRRRGKDVSGRGGGMLESHECSESTGEREREKSAMKKKKRINSVVKDCMMVPCYNYRI